MLSLMTYRIPFHPLWAGPRFTSQITLYIYTPISICLPRCSHQGRLAMLPAVRVSSRMFFYIYLEVTLGVAFYSIPGVILPVAEHWWA